MDIRKLQRTIVDALEDVKAQDIQVFNTEALTSLFDRVIVASGTSNRQTRALAATVRDKVRDAGGTVKNPEGAESGEWVLVDCGDAVVHIMQPAIRAYYKLEDIWGGKTVHLKALQAPEAARAGARAPSAAKPGAGTRKAPARRATASTSSRTAVQSAAKSAGAAPARPAAKRPAAKSPAATSAPTRSAAGKSTAAKAAGSKAAGAKSAAAKSTAPAKASAGAPARKSAAAPRTPRTRSSG